MDECKTSIDRRFYDGEDKKANLIIAVAEEMAIDSGADVEELKKIYAEASRKFDHLKK